MKPYYSDKWTTIYLGDCREVLPELPKVDLVLTDPPYNVGKDYKSYNDRNPKYWQLMKGWFNEAKGISPLIVFTPGAVNLAGWMKHEKPFWIGCWYHSNACSRTPIGGFLVWEPILIYGKPSKKVTKDAWNIPIAWQASVGKNHPVPKPERLFDELVLEFSNPDNLILDPFLGSGTTCYCAKKLLRKSIGIEINEAYCEIAAKRLSQSVMEF